MSIEIQVPSYISFETFLHGPSLERLNGAVRGFSQDPGISRALSILRLLPGRRCYHNSAHTAAVIWVVTALGVAAELSDDELLLNGHAAAFHDIGFAPIVSGGQEIGHEEAGATFAAVVLKDMGYDADYADQVAALIRDTAFTKEPYGLVQHRTEGTAHFASYQLIDADLHSIGTSAFVVHLLALFNERNDLQIGSVSDLLTFDVGRAYLRDMLTFLSNHRWATPIAAAWFGDKKAQNILELKSLLGRALEHC